VVNSLKNINILSSDFESNPAELGEAFLVWRVDGSGCQISKVRIGGEWEMGAEPHRS